MSVNANLLTMNSERPEPGIQVFAPGAYFPNLDEPQKGFTVLIGHGAGHDPVGFEGSPAQLRGLAARLAEAADLVERHAHMPSTEVDDTQLAIDMDGFGQGSAFIGQVL